VPIFFCFLGFRITVGSPKLFLRASRFFFQRNLFWSESSTSRIQVWLDSPSDLWNWKKRNSPKLKMLLNILAAPESASGKKFCFSETVEGCKQALEVHEAVRDKKDAVRILGIIREVPKPEGESGRNVSSCLSVRLCLILSVCVRFCLSVCLFLIFFLHFQMRNSIHSRLNCSSTLLWACMPKRSLICSLL
jgi:hypothetical protein